MAHQTPTQTPTRTPTRTLINTTTRYATPASLPAAFGVEVLHMWSSSPATSTRYTPSDRFSTAGSHTPGGSARAPSEVGLSVINELLRRPIPPSSTRSTEDWVRQTWDMLSTSRGSQTGRSEPASGVVPDSKVRKKATARSSTPEHMLSDPDEHLLEDGDFDVDGSVPDSSEEEYEDEAPRRKSKYIDDAAKESKKTKRKRPAAKPRVRKPVQRKAAEDCDASDQEPRASKRRKKDERASPDVAKPANPLNKWNGTSQGLIEFSPMPSNFNAELTPLWTYSPDGVARQSPNHRALGDIHFSPSFAPGETFHYWVQVGSKEGARWEQYNPGRQHPVYAGYVLKEQRGKDAPSWILGSS